MLALRPLQRYFDFAGRSGRAEYWQWILLSTVASWIARVLDALSTKDYEPRSYAITFVLAFGTIIPQVAVGVRRLHDINRSGWTYGILLIAIAADIVILLAGVGFQTATGSEFLLNIGMLLLLGVIAFVIYVTVLFARPGDAGTNRYGPPDAAAANAPDVSTFFANLQQRSSSSAAADNDKFAAIERLAKLRDQGALTEEEFTAQKRKLLGDTGPKLDSHLAVVDARKHGHNHQRLPASRGRPLMGAATLFVAAAAVVAAAPVHKHAAPHRPAPTRALSKADQAEADADSDYYAEAAPFIEFRVRVFDAEGTEYCCLTMGRMFDAYGAAGAETHFTLPDNDHVDLTASVRVPNGTWSGTIMRFVGYGQVGEGFRLESITNDGQVVSDHSGPWADSPDQRMIQAFRLTPILNEQPRRRR